METRHRIDQPALWRPRFEKIIRRERLEHRTQLRCEFRLLEPVGLVEIFQERPVLLGHRHILGLLQPLHETRHRRQRHEIVQLWQFAAQLLDHLLDQEAAEGNSAQAALGVGDRVKHRGAGALDRHRPTVFG